MAFPRLQTCAANPLTRYQWLKRCDPTRPVQYENARVEPGWDTEEVETIDADTDIYCPMYPSPAKLLRYARARARVS